MKRVAPLVASLLVGCAGDDGVGDVVVTTWGEEYIEQGIPAGGEDGFTDAWSVVYERFLVNLGAITIADAGDVAAHEPAFTLVDHVVPGVKLVAAFDGIAARAWPDVSYEIARVSSDSALGPGVTEAQRAMMAEAGHSVYVEGTATRDGEQKTFAWGFDEETRYTRCSAVEGGVERDGLVVRLGTTLEAELTIHGDHPFYDRLEESADPTVPTSLRFDALAEVDDGDGAITLGELEGAFLDVTRYDPSGFDAATHGEFLRHLVRTIGHYRGEGECSVRPRR